MDTVLMNNDIPASCKDIVTRAFAHVIPYGTNGVKVGAFHCVPMNTSHCPSKVCSIS